MSRLVAVHTPSPPFSSPPSLLPSLSSPLLSLSSPFTLFSFQPVQSQQVVAEKEEEEFFGSWMATFSPSMFGASQPSSLPFLFPSFLPSLPSSLLSHSTFPALLHNLCFTAFFLPPCRHRSGPRTSATADKRESQLQTTGREGQKGSHIVTNFEHVLMSSV